MMKTSSLRILAALALACCGLTGCFGMGSGGPPDVVNPTVSQQDEMDVRWGLPKRVSKMGVRRSSGAMTSNARVTEINSTQAAPAAIDTVSEEVKNKLR